MQPSVAPSQSVSGSPATFTFDEDDILMGITSPSSRDMPDPDCGVPITASVASHSTDYLHDSKTKFHPCSKHLTLYQSFEDFGQQDPEHIMAPDSKPWHPFAAKGDYIFATITVEAEGMAIVMLVNDAGLCTAFDGVVSQLMPFVKFNITAPYKGEDMIFQVHICPLWDWALDLLKSPSLTSHFVWDAQQLFKHDEKLWDLLKTYEMHTTQQHKEALAIYKDKKSAGEKKLKSLGLCPVKNIFGQLNTQNQDRPKALNPSTACMGVWEAKLEEQVSAFPHWCSLTHFDNVIHITFSDGNKMQDMSRWLLWSRDVSMLLLIS
ncbi:hypothetical protein EDD17DRAFT_1869024 [Pisolithus thermaeus]|nr:hypothetical protein EDD17DRAFT_1869024 [Pisolithus thermaeus]